MAIDQITNREEIIKTLRRELVGPAPDGDEIDVAEPLTFSDQKEAMGPFRQKDSGEEIIQRDAPSRRYGLGVLYPIRGEEGEITLSEAGESSQGLKYAEEGDEASATGDQEETLARTGEAAEAVRRKIESATGSDLAPELDLALTASYRPSSMGVSFLADFRGETEMSVECTGGRYRPITVVVGEKEFRWWLREPASTVASFHGVAIARQAPGAVKAHEADSKNCEGLALRIEVFSRPYGPRDALSLVTVCLVNRTPEGNGIDSSSLFQSSLSISLNSKDGEARILPYPDLGGTEGDEEAENIALLYRNYETFAVGHGCAADWMPVGGRASVVRAECIPLHEVPSVTPEIVDLEGNPIVIPMAPLAGIVDGNDGIESLENLIDKYERWIDQRDEESRRLSGENASQARRNLERCRECAKRMRGGLSFLNSDELGLRAFRLANLAMLMQQVQYRRAPRKPTFDDEALRWEFEEPAPLATKSDLASAHTSWRPFQIAFMLMVLESAANGESPDRDTVELIWFPTGGGKTEAYLGLAAFSLLLRRLRNPDDSGTHVVMRYTLRLLTTQQFQRASRLICALEQLRLSGDQALGDVPFSIGMWVGAGSTPNRRSDAVALLRALRSSSRPVENKLVINQCPWCAAEMGPIGRKADLPANAPKVLGYVQRGSSVRFVCPDRECPFHDSRHPLPVYVVDDDIYEVRPSLVIGTVDKFALLAWEPRAKSLFGMAPDGARFASPPAMIVQDELHLISGPLGSMVGLYEVIIEELCTDRRSGAAVRPKIVSSTATIRRYETQIHALYARDSVCLFPSPELDAGESFFGRLARDDEGNLKPGKIYVGVHAPGLGSMQTVQVRTITALLQAPVFLEDASRDPWWTLMIFFNSLRELGTTLSLLQSDIPDYQKAVLGRVEDGYAKRRSFWNILELTGRASSEEIPQAIRKLETAYSPDGERAVDVCLASSILEVGIDIDRLSLMMIVGQPKTTSQYIQVTGRIGRTWWEQPGLVVTLYSASKPRDRSHFERFRSYHERLYAQVEPASVTPYSPPALDRALHAVMAAYVRQTGPEHVAESPYPFPSELVGRLKAILIPRVRAVSPGEVKNFEQVFDSRAAEWQSWQNVRWRGAWEDNDIPLLRPAGEYATPEFASASWQTPLSMRTVDAACVAEIAFPTLMKSGAKGAE